MCPNEYQFDRLRAYIIDRFINEEFECAEWEDRFNLLEEVKEIYIEDMQWLEHYKNFNITDGQRCVINTEYGDIKTLVIPIDMFNDTDLSPFEIIVYNLKYVWDKTYAEIARMLNRDPSTIETVFKRAFFKLEGDCQYVIECAMNGNKLDIEASLHGIQLTDAKFNDAFKKIDDEIFKPRAGDAIDENTLAELSRLKKRGCTWVDYKHAFGYDDELMIDIYNAAQSEDSEYKDVIDQAIRMGTVPTPKES